MENLSQKETPTYLIIGATGGIGSDLSRKLRQESNNVILSSNNIGKLEHLSKELDSDYYELDATKFSDVENCINHIVDKYHKLDGVVNCVGSILLKPSHITSEEEWKNTVSLNLTSAFATVRSSARAMMESNGGSIVLVSSAAALVGLTNHEAIAAAKAGVIGLVLSAAATYSRYGIRVNCVAPGLVRTPLTETLTQNDTIVKKSERMHALGRLGNPKDVSSAISWFLHSDQNWVTGQVLGIDGGLAKIKAR